ncbi:MAG: hypothetical protein NC122_08990 [Faecalibacterium sp.]|nr:hypothetical protein [Ruminococcus sp.]MCM1392840.1 hypothetical protein [Ruminococcus sp.]MCM1486330.1 hypothetical protein [Faecalibacterium sp.]
MNKHLKRILALFLSLIFIFIILPYIVVEFNTLLFKSEFANLYTQAWDMEHLEESDTYCKVFLKTPQKAKVFYATETNTYMFRFNKNSAEEWELENYECLWSTQGSASNFSYPFYKVKGSWSAYFA